MDVYILNPINPYHPKNPIHQFRDWVQSIFTQWFSIKPKKEEIKSKVILN